MARRRDITGERFDRLVAIRPVGKLHGKTAWECKCDCGQEKIATLSDLVTGKVKSCGCLHRETAMRNAKTTHGMTGSRLWTIWCGMKRRCKVDKNYKAVSVCKEWLRFEVFRDWSLANGYSDELTIDRIDPCGDYEPTNCRWVSMKEQQNNRRNNRKITYNGKTQTLSMWAEQSGFRAETLAWRLDAGWPESDLFIPANLNNARLRKVGNYNAQ